MNLPEQEEFTIKSLARRWGKDEDYIEQLIESGELHAKVKEGKIPFDSSNSKEMCEWERCNRLVPHPYRLPVGGVSRPFGSKIIIPLSEVKRIEAPPSRGRHVITESERGKKSRSAIQVAIENYLDEAPNGKRAGFYEFLNGKLKLATEQVLKDGQSYNFYFDKPVVTGSREGVYLNGAKEGRKPGTPGYNHYNGGQISGLIAKERGRRRNRASLK
ncbi:MAG TPA: hypothetical protein PK653_00875 [Syntrophales bacterium]|nr:hypothetical protein [Syntrophales bacterium]